MKGKISVELILAGVLMVLIVAFVVWYGWLMVQIGHVGEHEEPVAEMGTPTAEGAGTAASASSSPTASATSPSSALPTSPAPAEGRKRVGGGLGLGGKTAGLAPEDM